jgi:hypothetical protein
MLDWARDEADGPSGKHAGEPVPERRKLERLVDAPIS